MPRVSMLIFVLVALFCVAHAYDPSNKGTRMTDDYEYLEEPHPDPPSHGLKPHQISADCLEKPFQLKCRGTNNLSPRKRALIRNILGSSTELLYLLESEDLANLGRAPNKHWGH